MAPSFVQAGLYVLMATAAIAQPHGHQQAHKRKIVTQVDVVTVQAPDVVVYVDEAGRPISVGGQATPAPQPIQHSNNGAVLRVGPGGVVMEAPSAAPTYRPANLAQLDRHASNNPAYAAPAPPSPPPAAAYRPAPQPAHPYVSPAPPAQPNSRPAPAPAPAPAPPAPPANPAPVYTPPAPVNPGSGGMGITWSPYTTKGGPCKTYNQAVNDFQRMGDMSVIRIYGVDCDQVAVAMRAGAATGKRVFAGVFNLGNVRSETQQLINAVRSVGNRWDLIDTISIGNEDIGSKGASVDSVSRAMSIGTPMLRQAGYNGPIVHVDTAGAFMDRNNLANGICDTDTAGDYIAVNIHPFFNSQTTAANAGPFVRSQVAILRDNCGNANNRKRKVHKRDGVHVRVTEAGWPKAGQRNGLAVPGLENQRIAVESIKRSVPDVLLFSAFNAQWQDPGYLGVEPYWGILDD